MEEVGQNYGYILYRTKLKTTGAGDLVLDQLHSYARIYLDGALVGILDRRLGKSSLPLTAHAGQQLDILVENTGRVNFSIVLRGERAGITNRVLWRGLPLIGWKIYPLPMGSQSPDPDSSAAPQKLAFTGTPCIGPCFYRAHFTVAAPGDTFLDVRALGKGAVWINGHALGRFWKIGPQQTLYVPGPWLRQGENEIVVFDIDGKTGAQLSGLDHPILDGPNQPE